jgi:hypothetical protein
VRLISSFGISGASTPRDFQPTLGFGTRVSKRFSEYLTAGIRDQILLRNWRQAVRYYDDIYDCEKIDTRCDRRADYWALGWALVFTSAEVGWDFMLRTEGTYKPWLAMGSSLILYNDNTGFASPDKKVEWVLGHIGTVAAGYDLEVVGVSAHVSVANNYNLLATTGPPLFQALLSIDVLLPTDHEDRKPKKRAE